MGQEDCLYLNVYSPDIPVTENQRKLPVLVWLLGHSFTQGNHDIYAPDRFMDTKELVIVTVTYRLGVFGFLSLGIEECPGNQGLWDQVLALEWIRDNICAFGGDNSNVTLVGHGCGSICASYHLGRVRLKITLKKFYVEVTLICKFRKVLQSNIFIL